MRQITYQLKIKLIGGWYQSDLEDVAPRKREKKNYGKKPFQFDWVDWLWTKLNVEINNLVVAMMSAAEFARGAWFAYKDVMSIPVTKRSKNDKKWLIHYHVQKAKARKKKAQYNYRAKKHAWALQTI